MNYEILKPDTAEKLKKYEDLLLEKKEIINFLQEQIKLNRREMQNQMLRKDLTKMVIARSKLSLAQELLYRISKKKM